MLTEETFEVSEDTEVSMRPEVVEVQKNVVADSEVSEALVRGIRAQPGMPTGEVREAQLSGQNMSWIIRANDKSSSRPVWETVSDTSTLHKTLWSLWDQLEVREKALCRKWESDDGRTVRWRLVLPEKFREVVLQELHGGRASGHLGVTKTLAKVKLRYYWPVMTADVRSFLRRCEMCGRRKSPAKRRVSPLQQYRVGEPM